MRLAFQLILGAIVIGAPALSSPCGWLYKNTVSAAKGVGFVAGGVFYAPVTLPVKLARDIRAHWKEGRPAVDYAAAPFRRLWADKWQAGIYAVLKALQLTTGLTFNQYQNATTEFDIEKDEDVRVIVDAFPTDDLFYPRAGTYVYELKHRGKKNVFLLTPKNDEELAKALEEITKKVGRPITHLDYYGHGLPGRIDLDHSSLSGGKYHSLREDQDGFVVAEARGYGVNVMGKGTFAPGARIRFNSCFGINGEAGRDFMTKFGDAALGEEGGIIHASKVQILPNLVEILALKLGTPEPPGWLRTYGDLLSAYNGILTLGSGTQMRAHGLTEEGPFHLARTEPLSVQPSSPEQRALGESLNDTFKKSLTQRLTWYRARERGLLEAPWEIMQAITGTNSYREISGMRREFEGEKDKIAKVRAAAMQFPQLRLTYSENGNDAKLIVEHPLLGAAERAELIAQKEGRENQTRAEIKRIIEETHAEIAKAEKAGRITPGIALRQREMIKDVTEQLDWVAFNYKELYSTVPNELAQVRSDHSHAIERMFIERTAEYTGLPPDQIRVVNGRIVSFGWGAPTEMEQVKSDLARRFPTFTFRSDGQILDVEMKPPPELAQAMLAQIRTMEADATAKEAVLYRKEREQLAELRRRNVISEKTYERALKNIADEQDSSKPSWYRSFLTR